MDRPILVTGANGFVGSHIVDCLLRRGYTVRALVRATSDLTWLANKPVETVLGTLDDPESLRAAVQGVGGVIHNAGVVSAPQRYLYYRANSEGTHHLVKALLDTFAPGEQPRLVYVSSEAAGGPSGTRWRREEDECRPITAYGHSKRLAEIILLRYQDDLPISIVRPPAVYGPRDRAFLPFFELVSRGVMPLFGDRREVSLVHVQDLARQIATQLSHENAVGEIFNAAPFPPVTLAEFGDTLATVLGTSPRQIRIPDAVLRYGYPALHPLIGLVTKPPFQVDKLPDMLTPRWTLDGSKAIEMLGVEGKLPLQPGLGQTAEWYRWKDWLRSRRDRLAASGKARVVMRPISNTMRLYDESCDLCGLTFDRETKTTVHYEDDDIIIVDCLICQVPMAVLKEHRASFTAREKESITAKFNELFGDATPDFEQRRIPTHAHVHYRKEGHAPPWARRVEG